MPTIRQDESHRDAPRGHDGQTRGATAIKQHPTKKCGSQETAANRGGGNKIQRPAIYVSDNEDETLAAPPVQRRSEQILSQREDLEEHNPNLHRIYDLAETEQATVPPLAVEQRRLTQGYHAANLSLQLDKWAHKLYFAGAIIDQETGEKLEYWDLIKNQNAESSG